MESKDKMLITGGNPLVGEITVSGGKNTAVAVIPAALLCNEPCTMMHPARLIPAPPA